MTTVDIEYSRYCACEQIVNEIKERISMLHSMGFSDCMISELISLKPHSSNINKILITKDFRILIPNYDNMEIRMPTLSKVLYFFFLNHPEGMMFKELKYHWKELLDIYMTISPRKNIEQIKQSINDIIDSNKNSVNEKCSRIKSAFTENIADDLAQQYYIIGQCGKSKKIELDRSLVINHSELKIHLSLKN